VFNIFWLSLTFFIPIATTLVPKLRDLCEKFMPIVPWSFGLLFLSNWFLAKLLGMLFRSGAKVSYIVHDVVEIKECNFGFFFAVVAAYLLYILLLEKKKREQPLVIS
jgi:hypothetical protein